MSDINVFCDANKRGHTLKIANSWIKSINLEKFKFLPSPVKSSGTFKIIELYF